MNDPSRAVEPDPSEARYDAIDSSIGKATASPPIKEQESEHICEDAPLSLQNEAQLINVRHLATNELKSIPRRSSYDEFIEEICSAFMSIRIHSESSLFAVRGDDPVTESVRITSGNYTDMTAKSKTGEYNIYFVDSLDIIQYGLDSALPFPDEIPKVDSDGDSVLHCLFCFKNCRRKQDSAKAFFLDPRDLHELCKPKQRALMRYCGLINLSEAINTINLCRECHSHFVANDIAFKVDSNDKMKRIVRDTIFHEKIASEQGSSYGNYHKLPVYLDSPPYLMHNLAAHRMKKYDEKTARLKENKEK